jgi:hypothetical protein
MSKSSKKRRREKNSDFRSFLGPPGKNDNFYGNLFRIPEKGRKRQKQFTEVHKS